MPYTVQQKDDSLELFVKFMETPEGEALFRKECEKLRQVREAEVRQKGLGGQALQEPGCSGGGH